ncbi:MAG: hypothetical protein SFV19_06705 [Rhodospirillaceae bacterium]|nr:hypothetical protein [Rhodospirillaceae bacterium]
MSGMATGARSVIKSIQRYSAYGPDTGTTVNITISAVDMNKAVVIPGGFLTSDLVNTPNGGSSFCNHTLTNSTTVSVKVAVFFSGSTGFTGTVVEYY